MQAYDVPVYLGLVLHDVHYVVGVKSLQTVPRVGTSQAQRTKSYSKYIMIG